MANSNLLFFPKSTERRSINREVNPEPVPPPKEWNIRNPWSPTHNRKWLVKR